MDRNPTRSRAIRPRLSLLPLALAAALVGLGGCQGPQLQEERDRLFTQNQELEQQLADARAANDALQVENEQLRQQVAQRPDPSPAPQARQASQSGFSNIAGVETEQTAAGVAVRVPGDVLFAPGQAEVQSGARSTLNEIARTIRREYPNQTVRVEGYTDTDPIRQSDWTDNLELSLHRAAAVERHLINQGIEADRLYSAGFGEARPRATKEESRRVEIVVVQHE